MYNEQMYKYGSNRSVIRDLFEYGKLRAEEVGAENVYDFSLGNPSVPAPDIVNQTIRDLTNELDSISLHGYTSAQGDADTRTAIAEYLNKTYGTSFHKDNFYMTCGAAASLTITMKALVEKPDDNIIAIAPFFPEYTVFANSVGAEFRMVPADTENFQIRFDELEKLVDANTRAVIINSPNNPSGTVYSEETIQKLAALLERKQAEFGNPIFILADEPYREIVYDGVEVPYVTKYYKNTVVCYSYSKSLSLPGDRIGYILVPDEACESKRLYAAVCGAGRALGFVCAPSLFQKTIARCVGYTNDINEYKKNRDLLYDSLTEIGYECFKPQGAFYLFMKSLGESCEAFSEAAKKENILVVPATGFGCPGYVRISYCVDNAMIQRSIPAFKRLYDSYGEN